jgi:hypothetical protein
MLTAAGMPAITWKIATSGKQQNQRDLQQQGRLQRLVGCNSRDACNSRDSYNFRGGCNNRDKATFWISGKAGRPEKQDHLQQLIDLQQQGHLQQRGACNSRGQSDAATYRS